MKSHALLLAILAFTLSCGEDGARLTQVLVVIQAPGEQIKSETTRLEVALRSGPSSDRSKWKEHAPELFEDFRWPASLALVPANDEVETGFEVVVTAYHDSTRLVIGRVISQFVTGRTLLLEIPLEDGCINFFSCGPAQTCDATTGEPRCETASVDPKTLPAYDGPGKIRDNTDTGNPDGGADGDDGSTDAGPCVPSGAEACYNGKDDDCNGATDCADTACDATSSCVPGDEAAGVLVGADEACPAGFTAEELPLHKGLTGGGCTGCTCSATPTTCSAELFVYTEDHDSEDDCTGDVYNQGGTRYTVNLLYNDWTDGTGCPLPIQDGSTEGFRTMAITPTDGTCMSGGTAAPETASWTESAKLCNPPAVGAGCTTHQVCMPKPAGNPVRVCGVVASANSCATTAVAWYDDFTDDRSCGSCRCDDGAGGSCAGVKVQFGNDWSCTVNYESIGANEKDCGYGYSPPAFLTGTPTNKSCIPSASSSGSLTPTGKTTLCCVEP